MERPIEVTIHFSNDNRLTYTVGKAAPLDSLGPKIEDIVAWRDRTDRVEVRFKAEEDGTRICKEFCGFPFVLTTTNKPENPKA
jgi:hypothetical protein